MPEGPGPTMSQNEWNRVRANPRFAHEMHGNARDVDLILLVAIDGLLCFAPVVGIEPVVNEFLKVGTTHTVIPIVIANIQRPSGKLQSCTQVRELLVRNVYPGGLKWKRGACLRGSLLACRHSSFLFFWCLHMLFDAGRKRQIGRAH